MLDGRVKTLHPAIHGGLLARRDAPDHGAALADHGLGEIDLLVVNLYPFEQTLAAGAGFDEALEQVDIGGPAMIRAASKNHDGVAVLVDPADYGAFLAAFAEDGATDGALRRRLAAKAFARTAAYDAAIAVWLAGAAGVAAPLALAAPAIAPLRYGENPHQSASFHTDGSGRPGVATARLVQGKRFPSIISPTPTPPSNSSPSSAVLVDRPAPSSSTPTRAAAALSGAPESNAICSRINCS